MSTGAVWAVFVVILVNTIFLAVFAVALWRIHDRVKEVLERVQPLIDASEKTLQRVEQLSIAVSDRANRILDRTGELVEEVARKVETTTSLAEETLSQPLIGAASLMAGISQGISALQSVQEKGE